jgi:hypothetical protein
VLTNVGEGDDDDQVDVQESLEAISEEKESWFIDTFNVLRENHLEVVLFPMETISPNAKSDDGSNNKNNSDQSSSEVASKVMDLIVAKLEAYKVF